MYIEAYNLIISKGPSSQSYGFSSSHVWMCELDYKKSLAPKNWCFCTMVLEKTLEGLGQQGDPNSPLQRKSVLNIHCKDWCWSWNSSTLAIWSKELTHWKRPWPWERMKVAGEGDDRGWDGRIASLTQWTWVWGSSGSWWWTGRPGVLQSMGSQRVRHDWATELNWCSLCILGLRKLEKNIPFGMGREEGGGFRMGNTCIPVADSFWYLAKLIQFCKV